MFDDGVQEMCDSGKNTGVYGKRIPRILVEMNVGRTACTGDKESRGNRHDMGKKLEGFLGRNKNHNLLRKRVLR